MTEGVPARTSVAIADTGVRIDALPDHDLTPHELLDLAAAVAAHPDLWRAHVDHSDGERHYTCLHRDSRVDVWVLCWSPSNDTGWHDHDISSGAVAVAEGCLVETNLAVGLPSVTTEVRGGRVFSFGPSHIHRLVGLEPGTVSIHAYSPPLWRMGQYAVGAEGVLQRTSVSYADELRPLEIA